MATRGGEREEERERGTDLFELRIMEGMFPRRSIFSPASPAASGIAVRVDWDSSNWDSSTSASEAEPTRVLLADDGKGVTQAKVVDVEATPERRGLENQLRQQAGQMERLKAFQERIDRQNGDVRAILQQIEDERRELESTVTRGDQTVGRLVAGMDQRTISSVERWPGENDEDNSYIISNGSHMILVDCVESVRRAQQLAAALLERSEELHCIFLTRAPARRIPQKKSGESLQLLRRLLSKAPVVVATQEIKTGILDVCSDVAAEVLRPGGRVSLPSGGSISCLRGQHSVSSDLGRHMTSVWVASEKVVLCGDIIRNRVHARCSPPVSLRQGNKRWLESWVEEVDGLSAVLSGVLGGLEGVRVAPGAGEVGDAASLFAETKLYLQAFAEETSKDAASPGSVSTAMQQRFPKYNGADTVLAMSVNDFVGGSEEDLEDQESEEDHREQQGRVRRLSKWANEKDGQVMAVKLGRRASVTRLRDGDGSGERDELVQKIVSVLHSGWPCQKVTSSRRLRRRLIKLKSHAGGKHALEWPAKNLILRQSNCSMEISKITDMKYGEESKSTKAGERGKMVTISGSDGEKFEFKMESEEDAKTFVNGVWALTKTDAQTLSQIIQQVR